MYFQVGGGEFFDKVLVSEGVWPDINAEIFGAEVEGNSYECGVCHCTSLPLTLTVIKTLMHSLLIMFIVI
jgi:hypothetical protein